MIDPIDRIVDIVFQAQGELTLNEMCSKGRELVAIKAREELNNEFEIWFRAKWKLAKLEDDAN